MSHKEAIILGIVSLGAFFLPILCKKILIPSAVGEILFGLFLGMFIQGINEILPTIKFLSGFGFIILMYLAGLEIDFQMMKNTPIKIILMYFLFFVLIIAVSFCTTFLFKQPVFYLLVYLTCAVGMLFPVLKDTGLLSKEFGKSLLILGAVGEIVTIFTITIFILYLNFGVSLNALLHLLEIAGFLVISYVIFKAFNLYVWWNPLQIGLFLKTGDAAEIGIRANFVNMFVFVSLASVFGLELIIGAFFGGILFAMIFKQRGEIKEKISAFGYGFLIPIFFIEVGLRFDVKAFFDWNILCQSLQMAFMILIIRVVSSAGLMFSNFSLHQLFSIAVGLSFPLTLLVAVGTIGLEMNAINQKEAVAILLTAVITSLVYPWFFKLLWKKNQILGIDVDSFALEEKSE